MHIEQHEQGSLLIHITMCTMSCAKAFPAVDRNPAKGAGRKSARHETVTRWRWEVLEQVIQSAGGEPRLSSSRTEVIMPSPVCVRRGCESLMLIPGIRV